VTGPRRVDAAEVVAAVRALPRGRTTLVGIDGYGGSGKSTLAALIAEAVPDAVVVRADDFASPSVPEWDHARFRAQVLVPLLDGRPARYQRWDWHADAGAEWHDIPVGALLIVEGVSSTRSELAAPWDLTIWVEAPEELRLARALERDGPDMLPTWLSVWLPEENAYVVRERPQDRVDLIVPGYP
jgi:uridine kinase